MYCFELAGPDWRSRLENWVPIGTIESFSGRVRMGWGDSNGCPAS
jgi:hypothetical protein